MFCNVCSLLQTCQLKECFQYVANILINEFEQFAFRLFISEIILNPVLPLPDATEM